MVKDRQNGQTPPKWSNTAGTVKCARSAAQRRSWEHIYIDDDDKVMVTMRK